MEKWRNINKRKKLYLSMLENGRKIVIFDVETNGLKDTSKIIQFSGTKYNLNGDDYIKEAECNMYINPEEKLPDKIVEITGITDEMLESQKPENGVVDEILAFLFDADILIGYNVEFDLGMIKSMCNRTGRVYVKIQDMDVLEMSRDFCDQNILSEYTLGSIADYIFPEMDFGFHDSSEDIKATFELFKYFINEYKNYEEQGEKTPIHLERASLFINPKKQSQQRIRMHIAGGYDIGAIYYDIVKKIWSCKSNTASKRLFKTCDMESLEDQFMQMYGYRYNLYTVDDVAKSWLKFKRSQKKSV